MNLDASYSGAAILLENTAKDRQIDKRRAMREAVYDALAEGPLTTREIARITGLRLVNVSLTIQNHPAYFVIVRAIGAQPVVDRHPHLRRA